jgi:hypothetical protein
MGRGWTLLDTGVVACVVAYSCLFARFTADDASIVARVAEHVVRFHEPTFNLGDRVNVLTSPLEGLLLAALFALTGHTLSVYKALSAVSVAAALVIAARRTRSTSEAFVFLALTAASPFAMLWAAGGLETPILLCAVTAVTLACPAARAGSTRGAAALCAAATIAFWARYDAALFVAWPLGALLVGHRRSTRHLVLLALTLAACGAAIALPDLAFGHAWPTPFYVKTPRLHSALFVGKNALYEASFLLLSGTGPLLFSAWRDRRAPRRSGPITETALVAGLAATGAYGLIAATTHMMFSYRLFVPYLPTLALLLLERSPPRLPWRVGSIILVWQGALAVYVETRSINPTVLNLLDIDLEGEGATVRFEVHPDRSRTFEYAREGALAYDDFLDALAAATEDAQRHWAKAGSARGRPARVLTFAAGVVGRAWPDAYVFDSLSSFRVACVTPLAPSADYVLSFTRAADGAPATGAELVGARDLAFDGEAMRLLLSYLPSPAPNPLPRDLFGSCAGR